jgi:hypothetical protein
MIKEDNVSGAGLDCLRDWTNNVQLTIPIYVAERDYLCYTDTPRYRRIAYPIRIGYGYTSDTPRIRIGGVSEFY